MIYGAVSVSPTIMSAQFDIRRWRQLLRLTGVVVADWCYLVAGQASPPRMLTRSDRGHPPLRR